MCRRSDNNKATIIEDTNEERKKEKESNLKGCQTILATDNDHNIMKTIVPYYNIRMYTQMMWRIQRNKNKNKKRK